MKDAKVNIDYANVIEELRIRINNINCIQRSAWFIYQQVGSIYDWLSTYEEIDRLFSFLHHQFMMQNSSLECGELWEFQRSPAAAYGYLSYELVQLAFDEKGPIIFKGEKTSRIPDFTKKEFVLLKDNAISTLNCIADFLVEKLVLVNKKEADLTEKQLRIFKESFIGQIDYKLRGHILYCGKNGEYGQIKFDEKKSIRKSKLGLSYTETIVKLLADNPEHCISYEEIKQFIPSFSKNDFYAYRYTIEQFLLRAFRDKKLKVIIFLQNTKYRKHPPKRLSFQLIAHEKNLEYVFD